jgi:hypothetical protein
MPTQEEINERIKKTEENMDSSERAYNEYLRVMHEAEQKERK